MLTFSRPEVDHMGDSGRDTPKTLDGHSPVPHHKHPFRLHELQPVTRKDSTAPWGYGWIAE